MIVLGLPYDCSMDMWSAGACLYELYTGKYMFPGRSNNEMLRLFMEVKGPFAKKLIRRGKFSHEHFAEDCETFVYRTKDPVTGMVQQEDSPQLTPAGHHPKSEDS